MILYKEPIENYHANPAVSHSKLEIFRKCPLLYKKTCIDYSVEREDSDALKLGSALHCLLLDGGDEFSKRYVTMPVECPRRPDKRQALAKNPSEATLASIAFWQAWDLANGHKIALDNFEMGTLSRVAMAFKECKEVEASGFADSEKEVTFRSDYCPHFQLQCRTDIWDGDVYVTDLKTVRDYDQFEYNYHHFGYHRQAALYRSIVGANILPPLAGVVFRFCVIEMKEPFRVGFFEPVERDLAIGNAENGQDLLRLKECYAKNEWLGAPEGIVPIALPSWYVKKLEEQK